MFYVGQKVVCVDANPNPKSNGRTNLRKGEVYTVRGMSELCGVALHEVEVLDGFVGFNPSRFRPIQERKTDISVFEEILRKHSSPADQRKFETASAVGS